jgi:hypothetical protein
VYQWFSGTYCAHLQACWASPAIEQAISSCCSSLNSATSQKAVFFLVFLLKRHRRDRWSFVFSLFYDTQHVDCVALGWLANYEFERIWNEAVVVLARYCSCSCMEGLRKTMKPIVRLSVPAEDKCTTLWLHQCAWYKLMLEGHYTTLYLMFAETTSHIFSTRPGQIGHWQHHCHWMSVLRRDDDQVRTDLGEVL